MENEENSQDVTTPNSGEGKKLKYLQRERSLPPLLSPAAEGCPALYRLQRITRHGYGAKSSARAERTAS
jgi:hypothetical protein